MRNQIIKQESKVNYRDCNVGFSVRAIPMCALQNDIPRSQLEIVQYIHWLMSCEGTPILQDIWHHRLKIEFVGVTFKCISAGPDGIFNTNDDISSIG